MKLNINSNLTIGSIKEQFHSRFPFLDLKFFKPVWDQSFLHLTNEVFSGERLEEFQKPGNTSGFDITSTDLVSEVEQNFRKRFALDVQVVRHSGNTWLLTNKTDNYTLEQQNEFGKELSVPPAGDEPEDIHEQE